MSIKNFGHLCCRLFFTFSIEFLVPCTPLMTFLFEVRCYHVSFNDSKHCFKKQRTTGAGRTIGESPQRQRNYVQVLSMMRAVW